MTVNVNCEKVRQFRSQLTNTLDTWSRAISVVESIESNVEPDRFIVFLIIHFNIILLVNCYFYF